MPRIEKTLLPNVFFEFVDDALESVGGDFTDNERVFVKMLHLSIFKTWGAMIEQNVPANIAVYDVLTPTRKSLISDMIRVHKIKELKSLTIKPLPSERITAPIIVDALMTIYAELIVSLVATDNIAKKVDAVLATIVLWIHDKLPNAYVATLPAFVAITRNITLVRMAQKHFTIDNIPKGVINEGWMVDYSIKDFNEYLRSDAADIKVFRVSELAATHSVNRFINSKTKSLKGVLVVPNIEDLKFVQWFHKQINIGSSYAKLIPTNDPTSVMGAIAEGLGHKFVHSQLVRTMSDIAQHTKLDAITTEIINAPHGEDFLMYCALVRSETVKLEGQDIIYAYKMDDALTLDAHNMSAGLTDVGQIVRTKYPMAVCSFSARQQIETIPFQLRIQTVERIAEQYLIPSDFEAGSSVSRSFKFLDNYFVEGEARSFQEAISLEDIVFTGSSLALVNVTFSEYLSQLTSTMISSLVAKIKMAPQLSHLTVRLANDIWLAFKSVEKNSEFMFHATNFRHKLQIPIDPSRPDEAAKNYVQSSLALTRMLLSIGTGVEAKVIADLFNIAFTGKHDALSLISDAELTRIAT
jgi:hypothetical protein